MKPAALITAALLTAAPAIAAGDTQPTAPAAPAVKFAIPRIPVVAHRGASFDFPENTLAAFRGAAAAGADGCEFDVHAAADGTLIIIHDNTLNRTTDIAAPRDDKGKPAKMPVAEKTPAEIKTLKLKALANRPWKAKDFAAERIPTLAETLAFFAGDAGAPRPVPVVEIKVEHIEPQVIAALRDARLYDRALIVSFSRTVVKTIRRLAPDLPVAWLYGGDKNADRTPAELVDFLSQTARELDTPLLDLSHKLLTKEIVTELHRRGFIVWAWTVDDPARMAELRAWGITSITSNKPALLKEVTSGK